MTKAGTLWLASENSLLIRSMKARACSTEKAGANVAMNRELTTLISILISLAGI
jgi:hypothetical protein